MKDFAKIILNIIALIVFVFMVSMAVRYKQTTGYSVFKKRISEPFAGIKKVIDAKRSNIKMELAPSRVKPLTLIEQEENLRMYIPNIFAEFKREDWSKFWGIMYNLIEEKKDSVMVKRYRNKKEVQAEIVRIYGGPFVRFDSNAWTTFWLYIVNIPW